jgi:hypothetical protein
MGVEAHRCAFSFSGFRNLADLLIVVRVIRLFLLSPILAYSMPERALGGQAQ